MKIDRVGSEFDIDIADMYPKSEVYETRMGKVSKKSAQEL